MCAPQVKKEPGTIFFSLLYRLVFQSNFFHFNYNFLACTNEVAVLKLFVYITLSKLGY